MPRRGLSTTPLQSLNLWNSRFLLQQADKMASRLNAEVGTEIEALIKRAWQVAYQRQPGSTEALEARELVLAEGVPALCRALLNSNEFLFIP